MSQFLLQHLRLRSLCGSRIHLHRYSWDGTLSPCIQSFTGSQSYRRSWLLDFNGSVSMSVCLRTVNGSIVNIAWDTPPNGSHWLHVVYDWSDRKHSRGMKGSISDLNVFRRYVLKLPLVGFCTEWREIWPRIWLFDRSVICTPVIKLMGSTVADWPLWKAVWLQATSWSTNDEITDAHISATIQQILTKFSAVVTYVKWRQIGKFQLICTWVTMLTKYIILQYGGKSWSKNKNLFCLIYLWICW